MSSTPSPSHLSNRLRHLALTSPPNTSLFYARIWHAVEREEHGESLHVLALAFMEDKQPYSAIHLVRDWCDVSEALVGPDWKVCGGCSMILARCSEMLGRFGEGQAVLAKAIRQGANLSLPTISQLPSPASSSLLLAKLSHKGKMPEVAMEQYTKSLQEEPWLWEAFTGLCDIGRPTPILSLTPGFAPPEDALFPDPPAPTRSNSTRSSRPPTTSPNPMPRSSASEVPGFLPRKSSALANGTTGFFSPDVAGATARLGMMGNPSTWDSPYAGENTFASIAPNEIPPLSAPRRPFPGLMSILPALRSNAASSSSASQSTAASTQTPVHTHPAEPPKLPAMKRPRGGHTRRPAEVPAPPRGLELKPGGREMKGIEPNGEHEPVRRSTRLKSTGSGSSTSSRIPALNKDKISTRSTRSRSTTSSASGATTEMASPPSKDTQLQIQADDWLRDIVRKCARAYRALSLYKCKEALKEIDSLPVSISSSPWAVDIVARAFYETANYVLARRAFRSLFRREPYRLQSSEYYSTTLWHLGAPPELSHFAQQLIAIDRDSPQAWIASGNCFSLQKDHEEAMRCFKRATALDPGCAYAWTLAGYEAVEMEEYERALGMYRTAIRTDGRHYNAWYGMGLVYLKMGKVGHAEHHFRRAAEINPTNAVLLCCIAQVLEQSDDLTGALTYYEEACRQAPESPMVLFKRIRLLVGLHRIDVSFAFRLGGQRANEQEAISALEPLSRHAPDEAQVQFLLGKCYLRKGRRAEAMVCLTSARELHPKLESAIKATIEADGEEADGEEDD